MEHTERCIRIPTKQQYKARSNYKNNRIQEQALHFACIKMTAKLLFTPKTKVE